MHRSCLFTAVSISLLLLAAAPCPAKDEAAPAPPLKPVAAAATEGPSVLDVLAGVEKRYGKGGVCGKFFQEAALAGVGVSDFASGTVCFKYPDKMYWLYTEPEDQLVVSDGKTLWIYRKADNQVMMGDAAEFFGQGDGAGFLANVAGLKKRFALAWATERLTAPWARENWYAVKLIPYKPRPEFTVLYLAIDKKTFEVRESISENEHGDTTRIVYSDLSFGGGTPEEKFSFKPPAGAEVLTLDEMEK
ncbi:MAG: outer membrane lipoprotein carrier protein LolA [Thermodesulfobacteriota bacterium]